MIERAEIFILSNESCMDFIESFDNSSDFISELQKKYDYIEAYHGTNLSSKELSDFYKNGFTKATKDFLWEKAISRFVCENDNSELKEKIRNEIGSYFSNFENESASEFWFGLSKIDLLERNYHYVLFGSEVLLPLASRLKNKFNIQFKQRLIDSGSHLIISVSVPVEQVEIQWLECLYEYHMSGHCETSLLIKNEVPLNWISKIEFVEKPIDYQNIVIN